MAVEGRREREKGRWDSCGNIHLETEGQRVKGSPLRSEECSKGGIEVHYFIGAGQEIEDQS